MTRSGRFGSCTFFFHALLLLQYLSAAFTATVDDDIQILQMPKKQETMMTDHLDHKHSISSSTMDPKDPQLQVFFTADDLKPGKKMPIYFSETSVSPPLLSKEEADSIPFHSSNLPELLGLFSFPYGSPQAKAIESTLQHCEFPPMKGETKFCATSLESLLDSIQNVFGSNVKFKVITTNHLTKGVATTTSSSSLQNYTIMGTPEVISAKRIVGCHPLPYPYAVYYCHSQVSDNKLFKVSLLGENGGRIEAAAMCHMNTSQWNRNHVAFLVLKTEPGKSSVCHFFPADNLVWIPSSLRSNKD